MSVGKGVVKCAGGGEAPRGACVRKAVRFGGLRRGDDATGDCRNDANPSRSVNLLLCCVVVGRNATLFGESLLSLALFLLIGFSDTTFVLGVLVLILAVISTVRSSVDVGSTNQMLFLFIMVEGNRLIKSSGDRNHSRRSKLSTSPQRQITLLQLYNF